MEAISNQWKKCSTCKKPIGHNTKYYECSVSTCTGERTGYVFCSVACFEVHLPGARHRSAGAVEKKSPAQLAATTEAPKRIIIQSSTTSNPQSPQKSSMQNEVLVVVSKMKQYIKDMSDMNTSEDVNHMLSQIIRLQLDRAIEHARREGRKTVMARDFKT
jgi:histone H3/H4